MSFRTVVVSNSASLNVKHNNLVINNGNEFLIPIEDISVLLIEGVAVNLTNRLLAKLSQNNVATVICNEKHLPEATIIPINSHHRSYKVLKEQINQSASFNKRIWKNIIKQKINNQARCLELNSIRGSEFLLNLSGSVESGDKGNREAIAAKFYFKKLFDENFTRDDDVGVNFALNYGYTIMRSLVARTLVIYGFNSALGVHHCNELNSFNLADDFMEVLRPIVDNWVYKNINSENTELTREERIKLVDLVNCNCIIEKQNHSVMNAVDKMISSYKTACNKKDFRVLKLPEIIELEYHYYE